MADISESRQDFLKHVNYFEISIVPQLTAYYLSKISDQEDLFNTCKRCSYILIPGWNSKTRIVTSGKKIKEKKKIFKYILTSKVIVIANSFLK